MRSVFRRKRTLVFIFNARNFDILNTKVLHQRMNAEKHRSFKRVCLFGIEDETMVANAHVMNCCFAFSHPAIFHNGRFVCEVVWWFNDIKGQSNKQKRERAIWLGFHTNTCRMSFVNLMLQTEWTNERASDFGSYFGVFFLCVLMISMCVVRVRVVHGRTRIVHIFCIGRLLACVICVFNMRRYISLHTLYKYV